jgi:hypothetical protein
MWKLGIKLFIMSAALLGVVYSIYYMRHNALRVPLIADHPKPKHTPAPPVKPAFNYPSVKALVWKADGDTLRFEKTKDSAWQPKEGSATLGRLIAKISTYHRQDIVSMGEAKLAVTIEFFDNSKWLGHWDGLVFAWKEGPLKGKGAVLSSEETKHLLENRPDRQ